MATDFAHQAGERLRHLARLARVGVAENHRPDAVRLKVLRRRQQRGAAIGDDALFDVGEAGRAGFRRFLDLASRSRSQMASNGWPARRSSSAPESPVHRRRSRHRARTGRRRSPPDRRRPHPKSATRSPAPGRRRPDCPPKVRERCLRTTLISPMGAPDFSNAPVTACSSASEMPATGRLSRLEPPPEISAST